MLSVRRLPVFVRSHFAWANSHTCRPLKPSVAIHSNICLTRGALSAFISTWLFSWCVFHRMTSYHIGTIHGRIPSSHFLLSPLRTFLARLSFSSFAWLQSIIKRNFSFGLLEKVDPCVRICTKRPSSIISTIDHRSPAFLESLSGAHVSIALYLCSLMPSKSSRYPFLCPEALADLLSVTVSTITSHSCSAIFCISWIWESIERACFSSDSDDFRAYKQYLRGILSIPPLMYISIRKSREKWKKVQKSYNSPHACFIWGNLNCILMIFGWQQFDFPEKNLTHIVSYLKPIRKNVCMHHVILLDSFQRW